MAPEINPTLIFLILVALRDNLAKEF